jgi:hypothetical protein
MAKQRLVLPAALVTPPLALALVGVVAACGTDTTTPEGSDTSGFPSSPVSPAAEGGVPAGTLGAGAPCSFVTTASSECASGICAAPDGTFTAAPEPDAAAGDDAGNDDAGAPPAGFCTASCGPPGNPSLDCNGAAFTGICGGTGVCRVRAL